MKRKLVLSAICLQLISASALAKNEVADSMVQNFKRSSLYTILITSDAQNKHYEEETAKGQGASELMSIAKSFANTDQKKAANDSTEGSIFALPAQVFTTIEIPNQFNDHNLQWRVINYDSIKGLITEEDLDLYTPKKKNKGAGLGAFAKSMVGMDTKGDEINAEFNKYTPAVLGKFFTANHIPEEIIAKWYCYNPEGEQHWSDGLVLDRGQYNFTPDELAKAATDISLRAKIDQTAFDLIGNTYVLAVNLRFRSYQAIVAEAAAIAEAVGSQFGSLGSLASKAASAGASAATGDGYTVQAVTDLYRLVWNDDINQAFAEEIFNNNGSMEDLINNGICKLEYLGTEKSSSNIRQSLFSEKPISSLVTRATARAIDEAIINLQNSHEEFRTVFPIIGGSGETVFAAIGTKEGLNEKDEYEILEAREKEDGSISYKPIGTVKAVKGTIWNNAYGAREEVEENKNATEADFAALDYGYSEFKGKKGDYKGYYIRLKKKKN